MEQQKFWVGVGFAAVFVCFLMYTINKGEQLNSGQRLMLRVLSALCAAIGGALISGVAFFDLSRSVPGGKLSASGTAGFAIFFTIWVFFPREPKTPCFPNGFNAAVPDGWTLGQTADTFAENDKATIDYGDLSKKELDSPVKRWQFKTRTPRMAIERLRLITKEPNAVRKYDVVYKDSAYTVTVKK